MSEGHRQSPKSSRGGMSMTHFYVRMTGLFLLVLRVGMAGGLFVGRETFGEDAAVRSSFRDLDAVTDVVTDNYYYRPTDADEQVQFIDSLEQHAISGMLTSLNDDYTRYLLPADAQVAAEQLDGEYGGIGVTLLMIDEVVSVAQVGFDTPASRAGISSGDIVVRIDNRPVDSTSEGLDGSDLRGPVGSTVTMTILAPGNEATTDISMEREAFIVHPVAWELVPGTTYMRIEIDIFGDRTTEELDQAIAETEVNGATGIVLDLRGNGGGWVTSAQETIGRFLAASEGPALFEDTSTSPDGATALPIINGELPPTGLPLIVLVDETTASAAEIVAGSLRDYHRALVIGEQTFGKGSVQRIFDFEDGSSLRVTVAEWFTPSQGRIEDAGIMPDVLMTTGENGSRQGDPLVRAAASLLDSGTSTPADLAQAQPSSPGPAATPVS